MMSFYVCFFFLSALKSVDFNGIGVLVCFSKNKQESNETLETQKFYSNLNIVDKIHKLVRCKVVGSY